MKTRFILSGIVAAAVIAFSGCEKVESISNVNAPEAVPFTLGVGIDTKTANDGVMTKWVENDQINVFHAVAGSTTYVSDSLFKTSGAGVSADFDGYVKEAINPSNNYDWYAFYPYTKQITTPANTSTGYSTVGSLATGSQVQNGADSRAHICGTNYPVAGVATGVPAASKPNIEMRNLTTLMKVVVTNGTSADINVSSVAITAAEDLVGQYYIDFTDPTAPGFTPRSASYVSKTASLSVTSGGSIPPAGSASFYLAVRPFTAEAGVDLTVSVATAEYGKQDIKKAPTSDVDFEAGTINTLNCTYTKTGSSVDYTLINSVDDLTLGSEILIVHTDGTYAAGPLGTYAYMAAKGVGVSGNKIGDPADVEVFTIANGNIAGTYALKCASGSGKFLTWTSSTSLSHSATLSNAGSWCIYQEPTGRTVIRSFAEPSRYMLFNESNNRFSTYVPNTGFADVKIYKNMTTGSGAITPKVAESLTITGATTNYTVGDTYSFDGTVTASFSDTSTEVLTPSQYTVNSSAVNMAVAGSYVVTVSYNADSTVKDTYTVIVSAGGTPKTSTLVFTDKCGGSGKADDDVAWTITSDGSESNFDTSKGIHYGTGSAQVKYIELSTSGITGTITKVVVNASTASGVTATVDVSVGGTAFGGAAKSITTTPTNYEFTGSASGAIKVTVTKPSKATKALYVKSIAVTYIN